MSVGRGETTAGVTSVKVRVTSNRGTNRLRCRGRRFESFLGDLSAAFVDVPADGLDAEIHTGLRKIVEFLGIDRSGFGQLVPGEDKFTITHSYEVRDVPPTPRGTVDDRFPVYARKLREGAPIRLPDDVERVEEATAEREYLARSGLKSQLTIPLKVAGTVVGGIGFASFRSRLEWPEDLVLRLRLVGDVFTHALARTQANESLQRAERQVQALRDDLARSQEQLLAAVRRVRQREGEGVVRQQEARRNRQRLDSLTPREREVFSLVGAGWPNKSIAKRLGLCLQTVKLHRGRVMRKLRLSSVVALARLAEKMGTPPPSRTELE